MKRILSILLLLSSVAYGQNKATLTPTTGAWSLIGNSVAAGNVLGSTNNASLRFITNNTAVAVLDSNGRLGIGTPAPGELLSLGLAGTLKGVLSLSGNTSGKVIMQPAAAAGTWTWTLPTDDGTANYFLQTDGNGVTSWVAGNSGTVTNVATGYGLSGGAITTTGTLVADSATLFSNLISTIALTTTGTSGAATWNTTTRVLNIPQYTDAFTGTVTSVSFTGGLISVATATTTPALTVAGTSGGIPYFSSTSTWASSALLAANAIMIGGGAGTAPSTTTTGTGVLTALGINVGSAGAFVTFNGALGTPSSGTVTNLTGTASININGTVGATTPTTGAFTTLSATTSFALTGSAATATIGGGATAAELRFLEPSGSGSNYTAFKAVAQGADITYSLPPTVGGAGTVLTDVAGNGVLTWVAPATGTVTAVSVASANGFAGSSSGGATPQLTLSTTITGLLQGNGTAISGITNSSTVGQVLRVTGASTYAWGALDLADTDARTGTLGPANGGTGVANNAASTITISGNFATTFTVSGTTGVTLPTSGTLATLAGTETFTNKRITQRVGTTASSATPTINTDNVDVYTITALATNITSFTTNLSGSPNLGDQLIIYIRDNGSSRTIAWGASFEAGAVALPTATTVSTTLVVKFYRNIGNTAWMAMATSY